jgi:hypothetical protein
LTATRVGWSLADPDFTLRSKAVRQSALLGTAVSRNSIAGEIEIEVPVLLLSKGGHGVECRRATSLNKARQERG